MMNRANRLREDYLNFFEKRGHKRIPSAPLVPVNDPTTLFTSSGMQPLIPYFLGEKHPLGKRLVNSQLCFRAQDIDEVGDNRHTTFFEMLGNWSLGDYFKTKQLSWFFEFLTEQVGLDSSRLFVSVFEGSREIPKDKQSIKIWQQLFETKTAAQLGKKGFDPQVKIYLYGPEKNWWSRVGMPEKMPPEEPGGPDSEVFYDLGSDLKLHENSPFADQPCHINCDCGRFLEIGNSVFMEYKKNKQGGFDKLPQKNVDFGGGFERILAAVGNQPDMFKTEIFLPIIKIISQVSGQEYDGNEKLMQVVADHLKAAVFMIDQGLKPDNKQQGYFLRRLLRRSAVKMYFLHAQLTPVSAFEKICNQVIDLYQGFYFSDISKLRNKVAGVVSQEMGRFSKSLNRGLKVIKNTPQGKIDGKFAFNLYQTYGFPFEITQELLEEKKVRLEKVEFDQAFEEHQKKSRASADKKFKGGLVDHSQKVTKLHTATHLLHQALRLVLGKRIKQVGSNITPERLRFDFTYHKALTKEEIEKVEALINQRITDQLPVTEETMPLKEAKQKGALAFFGQKYPDKVKVYSIGDFSKEVCGGPHVENTGQIGHIKIINQENIGAGKCRIYAVIKNGS